MAATQTQRIKFAQDTVAAAPTIVEAYKLVIGLLQRYDDLALSGQFVDHDENGQGGDFEGGAAHIDEEKLTASVTSMIALKTLFEVTDGGHRGNFNRIIK